MYIISLSQNVISTLLYVSQLATVVLVRSRYVTMMIKVPQNHPKAISLDRALKKKQIDTNIAEIGYELRKL